MSRKILLIENDSAIAAEVSRALEARGLEVRTTGDGKEGLELARDARPDAIVLCVELPRMSGYSVCQKLKKDDGLRSIPLVLTSAEATEETFEAHRKLKARAEEYLIKPYTPAALLAKLATLVDLPPAADGEEMVTLDDVQELSSEMPLIPQGERVRPSDALPAEDEDLKMLDDAFDTIAGAPQAERAPPAEAAPEDQPVAGEELRAAAALLPEEDEVAAGAEIDKLGEEADRALAALGADEPGGGDEPLRAPGEEALRAAGIPVLRPDAPAAAGSGEIEGEVGRLRDRVSELLAELARSREMLEEARHGGPAMDAAMSQASREAEARREAEERLRKVEAALRQQEEQGRKAAERAGSLEAEVASLRLKLEETEQTANLRAAQLASMESEASGLRSQVDAARSDLEASRAHVQGARADGDRRSADLQRKVEELEAANAKHEERVVKAFQKIKSDEKIREKTRKALAIALQLLDERTAAAPGKDPGEPAPRRE